MFTSLKEKIRQRREQAECDLKAVHVSSAVEKLVLDATSAEVVEQSENVVQDEGQIFAYYLTQVVRNAQGEYFLLKTTDGRPYVKHLSQERARVVLKAKYKAPGQSQ
jgi:hypothetical protein